MINYKTAKQDMDGVSENCPDMKRFIVIQMGARMHYAVPALLASRGMLDSVYLDAHADLKVIQALEWLWPKSLQPNLFRRLMGHSLPVVIPRDRVRSYFARTVMDRCGFGPVEDHIRRQLLQHGFGEADSIYSYINGDLEVIKAAKAAGLSVVYEQILNPDVGLILRDERDAYPGVETQDALEHVEQGIERDKEQWSVSDRVLVPSEFVLEKTLAMGAAPGKVALVPYGISEGWISTEAMPIPGRVLFVGTVGLRKGNHYLAAATRLLKRRGFPGEVRVVGPPPPNGSSSSFFAGPTYLGQVPRADVRKEFLSADVFVLPTLSDSFALVHLEALACGVPVITTPNCGSVVRDGIEGFIVPIRDSNALADRIQELVVDRHLRQTMSHRARARAKEFTWARYSDRLLNAINQPPSNLVC